ncbi:MAG: hypothetical protein AB1938_20370 [Myxococcota bacterium]
MALQSRGLVLGLILLVVSSTPASWAAPPLMTADGQLWRSEARTPSPVTWPVLPGAPPPVPVPPPVHLWARARPTSSAPDVPRVSAEAFSPAPASEEATSGLPPSPTDAPRADAVPFPADAPASEPSALGVEQRVETVREQPWLGAQLDVGFPDGLGASVMVMPFEWLRVQVGGSWNGASRGVRAALVALLFPSFFKSVRPTFSVEGGYAFDTDSRWLQELVSDPALEAALSRVTVLHGGGQLGVEFGSKYFSFFIRGGVSYVDVQLGEYEGDSAAVRGLALHGLFPSGKMGFLVCFL